MDFNGRPSVVLQRLADSDDRVSEYECDQDGHWLHLEAGWVREGYGSHSCRANTVTEVIEQLETIVLEN